MKNLFVLLSFALTLSACAKPPQYQDIYDFGVLGLFTQSLKNSFGDEGAIESSYANINGETVSFYDPSSTGAMWRKNLTTGQKNGVLIDARFSYVFEHNGVLYVYFTRREREIFRRESFDGGMTWSSDTLVIAEDADPTSTWHQVWNPAVAVDTNGVWHLLLEASDNAPNQRNVALVYATSNDGVNWTRNPTPVIQGGGNPYLVVTSHGLLAVHGLVYRPNEKFGIEWHTTASTFDGTTWTTHEDKFDVGLRGVHICDPHLIEMNGKLMMSVSVDQRFNTFMTANETLDSFHAKLLE